MGSPHYMSAQSFPGIKRLCAPQEAAALVRSGDKIAISANANTPRVWLEALFARAEQLENVEIMHMRLVGAFPERRLTSHAASVSTRSLCLRLCGQGLPQGMWTIPQHIFTRSAVSLQKGLASSMSPWSR